jgi:hypothetical protein
VEASGEVGHPHRPTVGQGPQDPGLAPRQAGGSQLDRGIAAEPAGCAEQEVGKGGGVAGRQRGSW